MQQCIKQNNSSVPIPGKLLLSLINQMKQIIGLNQAALNKDTLLLCSTYDT